MINPFGKEQYWLHSFRLSIFTRHIWKLEDPQAGNEFRSLGNEQTYGLLGSLGCEDQRVMAFMVKIKVTSRMLNIKRALC